MIESRESTTEGVDLEGMQAYLAETDVEFAVLFGSRARGTADTGSDVDIALGFPESLTDRDRFRLRNRVDAELQAYANGFVDVSDIESLPTPVAHAALRDGIVIFGDEAIVEAYKTDVVDTFEAESQARNEDRDEFIDRLARGDI
jgi:predicted nucleotidyltransferase